MNSHQQHNGGAPPIRVGIAGLGRSGWNLHALTIENHPGFQVAAVVDPEPGRCREAFARFGCRIYDHYEAMLGDGNLDLIVVATPSHTHTAMSCAALESGHHVLVEKPMATSLADGETMLETAERTGKTLTVFQTARLDPSFLKVHEIIASGVLGELHLVRLGLYLYQRRRDWQTLRKFGGGQLNNAGSHLIDLALLLSEGQWSDLVVDMRHVVGAGDAEDHVKIMFRGAGATLYEIELSYICAAPLPEWTVIGSNGSLWGRSRQLAWKYYNPAALSSFEAEEGPAHNRSYLPDEEIPWIEESIGLERGSPARVFYDRLYEALRNEQPLLVPPHSLLAMIAMQEKCRSLCAVNS